MSRGMRVVAAAALVVAASTVVGSTAAGAGGGAGERRTPTVTGPMTAGNGVSLLGPDMSSKGYVREEYFFEGDAANYQPVGALTLERQVARGGDRHRALQDPHGCVEAGGPGRLQRHGVRRVAQRQPGVRQPARRWLNSHNHFVR